MSAALSECTPEGLLLPISFSTRKCVVAGEAFDDEEEDCYWRLQGFVPGVLVEALDHAVLKRLIKAYMSIPFSGV